MMGISIKVITGDFESLEGGALPPFPTNYQLLV